MAAVKERNALSKAQAALEPKDDLTPYLGQWVALRTGRVIASDVDGKALRNHAEVKETDTLVPVSEARGGYFVA